MLYLSKVCYPGTLIRVVLISIRENLDNGKGPLFLNVEFEKTNVMPHVRSFKNTRTPQSQTKTKS